MAKFLTLHRPQSIIAMVSLVLFLGMMIYAVVWDVHIGSSLYLLAFLAIGLGFWSKDDTIAVTAVIGLNFLVIFDIVFHIAFLKNIWG